MYLVLCVACLFTLVSGRGGPVCLDSKDCVQGEHFNDEYFFKVHGQKVLINYSEDRYIEVRCPAGVSLESSAMPRFEQASVRNLTLRGCSVPRVALGPALAALGITVRERLSLRDTPAHNITQEHLHGLHHLLRLDLEARHRSQRLHLDSKALAPFANINMLQLNYVKMSSPEFPPTLSSLQLWDIGETKLDLNGLDKLESLVVHEKIEISVNASTARSLQSVVLDAKKVSFPAESRPSSLRYVSLVNWVEADLSSGCDNLEVLQLRNWNVGEQRLSLSYCNKLRELHVSFARLMSLGPELLEGVGTLETLGLSYCYIDALPPGLFNENRALQTIDLSHNRIQKIPSNLFSNLPYLRRLDLSFNKLQSEDVEALGSLVSLRELNLSRNPALGDLCSSGSDAVVVSRVSPLKALKGLEQLSLKHTSVSRVCSDWRTSMKELRVLDLSYTNISSLSYLDLSYERSGAQELTVNFHGTSITEILIGEDNYKSVVADLSTATVNIILKADLTCDCLDYWTGMAFRELGAFQPSIEAVCRDQDRSLVDALKDSALECVDPALCGDQTNCTCSYRPDLQRGVITTARCNHAGLHHVPAFFNHSSATYWRLLLPNNHIRTFGAQDLPSKLLELDLRNNSLVRAGSGTAAALTASRAELWLSGNPELDCTCSGRELVWAGAGVADRALARCADGSALGSAADPGPCGSGWLGWALGALGLGAVAAGGAAAYCARPETRLRAKVFLLRVGWLRRTPEPDDGRRFDAFVSYAHEDGGVVEELARRLEAERGYRLCLHYRDWGPGEWIHVQIAASVEASRRTLVVVSRHFLRSKWARQEFREAHAAALTDLTPRLLLLFLEPPSALPLDAELRNYIRINTYLLWDDPWFWRKLLLAMPPPPPQTIPLKQEQEV